MKYAPAGDTGILPDQGMTTVASPERLGKMAAKARAAGMEHIAALLETVPLGVSVCNHPRSDVPIELPEPGRSRGTVVILLDDEDGKAEGPGSFDQQSLRATVESCAAWAVISALAAPDLYRQLGMLAAAGWPLVVVIETCPTHEQRWVEYLKRHAPWHASQIVCTPSASAFRAGREAAGKPRH
jgi:hypothetical protein